MPKIGFFGYLTIFSAQEGDFGKTPSLLGWKFGKRVKIKIKLKVKHSSIWPKTKLDRVSCSWLAPCWIDPVSHLIKRVNKVAKMAKWNTVFAFFICLFGLVFMPILGPIPLCFYAPSLMMRPWSATLRLSHTLVYGDQSWFLTGWFVFCMLTLSKT